MHTSALHAWIRPFRFFCFFLGYGRCRTVARSLLEHKQSKRHLSKDPQDPEVQANHNQPKTTQNNKTTRKSPSQICISSKNSKPDPQRRKSPNKNNHKKDLVRDRSYHCVTLKNMQKLIIHHDIHWNIDIDTIVQILFSVQRLHGFHQVIQHVDELHEGIVRRS